MHDSFSNKRGSVSHILSTNCSTKETKIYSRKHLHTKFEPCRLCAPESRTNVARLQPAEREPLLNFTQPGAVRRTEASRATPCRRTLTTIRGTAVIQGFYAGYNNNKDFGTRTAPEVRFPTPRSFSLRNPQRRSFGKNGKVRQLLVGPRLRFGKKCDTWAKDTGSDRTLTL